MDVETTCQWTMDPGKGWEGIRLRSDVPIPPLGEGECLVQIEAVALNYRDVALPMGEYPLATKTDIVPCSDAAGTVIATGPSASRFEIGDIVCSAFNPKHHTGLLTLDKRQYSLGSTTDGVLCKYAVFHESGLVPRPWSLDAVQASTLPCAALTAWNCLFGLTGRAVGPGDWVLAQGTGGVSLFAVQIALAAGANVVATTSDGKKEKKLKQLGVQHVVNYLAEPNWGEAAKKLTTEEEGFHHVIDVGGNTTLEQSLKAVRLEGVISVVGFLGGNIVSHKTSLMDCLPTLAIIRGIYVGTTEQFEALNKFIDDHQIKPVVDNQVFDFDNALPAFKHLWNKKQFGKVVIRVK